jgi:hypothetical protein
MSHVNVHNHWQPCSSMLWTFLHGILCLSKSSKRNKMLVDDCSVEALSMFWVKSRRFSQTNVGVTSEKLMVPPWGWFLSNTIATPWILRGNGQHIVWIPCQQNVRTFIDKGVHWPDREEEKLKSGGQCQYKPFCKIIAIFVQSFNLHCELCPFQNSRYRLLNVAPSTLEINERGESVLEMKSAGVEKECEVREMRLDAGLREPLLQHASFPYNLLSWTVARHRLLPSR